MRTALIVGLCLLAGCSEDPTPWQQAMRVTGEEVVAKQDESLTILKDNTTALAAIKSQVESLASETREATDTLKASLVKSEPQPGTEVIKSALEPQAIERDSQNTPSVPRSAPAVRLFVTSSESCRPCIELWEAVDRGEFAGFDVKKSGEFEGVKSYPAIRFQNPDGQWKVLYGYDSGTVDALRTLTTTNRFVSQPIITNPVVSHGDLVSMHNQLHGGGNWTWPGDLATHLRESHGVQTGGQPTGSIFPVQRQSAVVSPRTTFRPVSYGSRFVGRSRTKVRASCPAGGCP